ncbi:hypothetical protein FMUND_8530, partial [Fusarium mundagurra]
MFAKISLPAIIHLAAMIPTTLALGCYSKGPTWDQVNAEWGNPGFPDLAYAMCRQLEGTYGAFEQKEACKNFGNLHVNLWAKNNLGYTRPLYYEECINAALQEMFACSHGSEQNFAGFWFTFDPNSGA